MAPSGQPIIVFDGVCNLCDRSVQFVIRHDHAGIFKFASLQSRAGRELLLKFGLDPHAVNTFLLVENNMAYVRSEAALRIAKRLSWPWRMLPICRVVPRPLRDRVYDFIARHRYRWFGKREACMVPTQALRGRFLD